MPAAAGHGVVWLKVSKARRSARNTRQRHCKVVTNPSHQDRGSPNLPDPIDAAVRHNQRASLKYP